MALRTDPLNPASHNRSDFSSGQPEQDEYLRRLATQHAKRGVSRTYVLVDDESPSTILGYYSLSACHLAHIQISEQDRRQLPRYPVPGIRIGQLAVDRRVRGRGYGELLLGSAVRKAMSVRQELGVAIVVVDARNERLLPFYLNYGFIPSSDSPLTLYLLLGQP